VTLRPIECRIYSRLLQAADSGSRSQMAAAFFNQLADRTKAEAISAGTEPGLRAHPEVLAAMQEIGIDLSDATPQRLTQELANDAALLITMGCGDKCPYVPGVRRDDWALSDPKGRPMDEVRAVRDDIKARVAGLIQAEGLEMEATWLFAQLRTDDDQEALPCCEYSRCRSIYGHLAAAMCSLSELSKQRFAYTAVLPADILDHATIEHGPFLMVDHRQFCEHRQYLAFFQWLGACQIGSFVDVPAQTALADQKTARS
jgi:arsenate reductase